MNKQGGKVYHIRWSPQLNRMVLVNSDNGEEVDVAFGDHEPPFVPTFEWYKHNGQ